MLFSLCFYSFTDAVFAKVSAMRPVVFAPDVCRLPVHYKSWPLHNSETVQGFHALYWYKYIATSATSVAGTLMARLPRLFGTRFLVPNKNVP